MEAKMRKFVSENKKLTEELKELKINQEELEKDKVHLMARINALQVEKMNDTPSKSRISARKSFGSNRLIGDLGGSVNGITFQMPTQNSDFRNVEVEEIQSLKETTEKKNA